MNTTNTLKVTVAFLAGLVLALSGALVYEKSNTPGPVEANAPVQQAALHQPAPARVQPPVETASTPVQSTSASDTLDEAPAPAPVHKSSAHKQHPQVVKHKIHQEVDKQEALNDPPPPPTPDPVQTAQVTPPPPSPLQMATNNPPAPAPPPAPQPQVVTLEPGTTLKVRINDALSSEHNYAGDTFRATLQSPIIRNGYIIADRGSQVLGRVVNAEKAGRVQGLADLTLALTSINTTDGQRISVQTNTTEVKGASSKKRDVAEVAGGSALGAIIGAIAGGGKGAAIGAGAGGAAGTAGALSTRGKPAVIPAETSLTFQLTAPVTITEKMNQ